MKDFLKYTLATFTGLCLTGIAVCVIGMICLVGMVTSIETEPTVSSNTIMVMDLEGTLNERSEDNIRKYMNQLVHGEDSETYGLDEILNAIRKAENNPNVKGIYIRASYLNTSYASLQTIRRALANFKEKSGKIIIAYADNYTQSLYYLSSVADRIILNPQGMIEWKGLAANTIFYKDLFDKLGIEMQIFKVGTYKSAVEPFIATEMSEANREQTQTFLHSTWLQIATEVANSRHIPIDTLNQYADRGIMFHPAEDCLSSHLADTLMLHSEINEYLKKELNIPANQALNLINMQEMNYVRDISPKTTSKDHIAIYYAYGEIDGGSIPGAEEGIHSDKVVKDLKLLQKDNSVKAVVLRVNSPGGSAFGSEQIWQAIKELKTNKPVVVSMGDYAASGGYYISSIADRIVAEPTTLTGSIGIFGIIPNVEGLTKKLGINQEVVKTHRYADFGNPLRPFDADEKAQMQMIVNRGYDTFIARCAEGRHIPKKDIEKVAEGRIWSGKDALKLGLIDELGGLDKAIQIAASQAKLKDYNTLSYPAKPGFFDSLLESVSTDYLETKALKSRLGNYYQGFRMLQNASRETMIQARIPFYLSIR